MNLTFNELRDIKHRLPTGSVKLIAEELSISEQTVRNYFGANDFGAGGTTGNHLQPGPDGGIVNIEDQAILKAAMRILGQQS